MSEPREGRPGSSSTFTVRSAPQRRRLDALARESRWWLRSATRLSRVRQREVSEIETGRTRIVDVGCVLPEIRAGSQEQQTTWSASHVSRKQLQDSRTGLFLPPATEVVGELRLLKFRLISALLLSLSMLELGRSKCLDQVVGILSLSLKDMGMAGEESRYQWRNW